MYNIEKILTILTFIVLLACQILILRSTTKKYYGTSIQGFSSYKIHSVIRLFTPCYIASRDYFRRNDILYKRTNFRVINYSDISNPNPKKFVKGIIRGSGETVLSNVKITNYYFELETAGYIDMLGLLTYCKEKGWIDYNVHEAGEKVIVFDIITREEREIAIDRKLAKLAIYNKYKYYDDMRERSKQIWIYFIQAIGFILVFSVSLATLLKM